MLLVLFLFPNSSEIDSFSASNHEGETGVLTQGVKTDLQRGQKSSLGTNLLVDVGHPTLRSLAPLIPVRKRHGQTAAGKHSTTQTSRLFFPRPPYFPLFLYSSCGSGMQSQWQDRENCVASLYFQRCKNELRGTFTCLPVHSTCVLCGPCAGQRGYMVKMRMQLMLQGIKAGCELDICSVLIFRGAQLLITTPFNVVNSDGRVEIDFQKVVRFKLTLGLSLSLSLLLSVHPYTNTQRDREREKLKGYNTYLCSVTTQVPCFVFLLQEYWEQAIDKLCCWCCILLSLYICGATPRQSSYPCHNQEWQLVTRR